MDYLNEPKGSPVENPDLHYFFLHWFMETYGEEWFWQHTDWSMNFVIIGDKPTKMLAIGFDDKKHYATFTPTLGVYDFSVLPIKPGEPLPDPVLLMSLNVADPAFFDKLKKIVAEFIPSTTQDALASNAPSVKAILQRTLDRSIPKSS